MSTITLDHLSEPQRQALQGPAPLSPDHFDSLATRFRAARTKARLFDRPLATRIFDGYARLASDLATAAREEQLEQAA
jgi:truncated hemoglobin YjbI